MKATTGGTSRDATLGSPGSFGHVAYAPGFPINGQRAIFGDARLWGRYGLPALIGGCSARLYGRQADFARDWLARRPDETQLRDVQCWRAHDRFVQLPDAQYARAPDGSCWPDPDERRRPRGAQPPQGAHKRPF